MREVESNHLQALTLVAQAILELRLPKLGAEEVKVRRYPWSGSGQDITYFRGISVHPGEEQESQGTNERDDIGYGVFITMLIPQNTDTADGAGLLPLWRRKIRKRFSHVRLGIKESGSNEITTTIRPGQYLEPRGIKGRYEKSVLLVRCWVRESTLRSERS